VKVIDGVCRKRACESVGSVFGKEAAIKRSARAANDTDCPAALRRIGSEYAIDCLDADRLHKKCATIGVTFSAMHELAAI
jgi:hypothetical protein